MSETQNDSPFFSIIVPVLDGAETLGGCLESIQASSFSNWELIVVDDGSADDSARLADRMGATVLHTGGREGPGAARNLGSTHARGEFLLFVDADCSVARDALQQAAETLQQNGQIDALFGSYDDAPSAPGAVARYKNLQHHYVHQQGLEEASTFWAGFGAFRKTVFERLGGFDTERYRRPCIEDIELGYRLTRSGGRIRLAKKSQVKHHKAWTLYGVLRSDFYDRGLPWTRLLVESERGSSDLNFGYRGRASVVLALLSLLGLLLAPVWPRTLMVSVGAGLLLVWLNLDFYRLLLRKGGLWLLLVGMGMHWLYQLNCAAAYVSGRWLAWRDSSVGRVSG